MIIGVQQSIYKGALVETLEPSFEIINPGLYRQIVLCGGAAAANIQGANIQAEGVKFAQDEILLIKEITDSFTPEEMEATLAHELAHIANGDTVSESGVNGKTKMICDLEKELLADLAAVKAVGAKVTKSALTKLVTGQMRCLTKGRLPKLAKVLVWAATRTGDIGKRFKALDALIAQGK